MNSFSLIFFIASDRNVLCRCVVQATGYWILYVYLHLPPADYRRKQLHDPFILVILMQIQVHDAAGERLFIEANNRLIIEKRPIAQGSECSWWATELI